MLGAHIAWADNSTQQVQMLNSQIQAQLQTMQAAQQKQLKDLNTQIQNQLKQMQTILDEKISTLNTQVQSQMKAMQTTLQQQIKQVHDEQSQSPALAGVKEPVTTGEFKGQRN
jgi:DNA anti-recombination protein RmuC